MTNTVNIPVMAVQISADTIGQLGQIVRQHRRKAGLSRIQLAEISGLGKTVIYDVENGKPTVRLSTLIKLFEVLNIRLYADSPLMEHIEVVGDEKS